MEIRLKFKSNVDIRHIKHTNKFLYLSDFILLSKLERPNQKKKGTTFLKNQNAKLKSIKHYLCSSIPKIVIFCEIIKTSKSVGIA